VATQRRNAPVGLRPLRPSDADAIFAACQDPEIPRWTLVPSPYTREHAKEFIARSATEDGTLTFAAAGPDDELLGVLSLLDLHREPGYAEIGYWLAAPARGRGLATQAVRLLTAHAHEELGLDRVEIHVHRENTASLRVPERAGYERLPGLHPSPRTGVTEPVFVRYVSRGR
jgi:RimJ/RimL family protein N-acetyltransferase